MFQAIMTLLATRKAERQTQEGAAFLDWTYRRQGWADKIEVSSLDLMSNSRCIGGQLEGEFDDFMRMNALLHSDVRRMGFIPSEEVELIYYEAWVRRVRERLPVIAEQELIPSDLEMPERALANV